MTLDDAVKAAGEESGLPLYVQIGDGPPQQVVEVSVTFVKEFFAGGGAAASFLALVLRAEEE